MHGEREGDYSMVPENLEQIKPVLNKIRSSVKPAKIILFGSRSKGTAREDSDYDLLVVSTKFKNKRITDRMHQLYRLVQIPVDIDFICLTPREFEQRKKRVNIISIAAKEGVEV